MPFWGGSPWSAFGWIFPLIGLLFMVVMAFVCIRRMGGMAGVGCLGGGHRGHVIHQADDLWREIQELKEEIRNLRDRG
jgi:hypothetical protein